MNEIQILTSDIIITAVHFTFPDTYTPPLIYSQYTNDQMVLLDTIKSNASKPNASKPNVSKPFSIKCGDIYFNTSMMSKLTSKSSLNDVIPCMMVDFSTSAFTMDSETRAGGVTLKQFEMIIIHEITNILEPEISEIFNDFHIDMYTSYPDNFDQSSRNIYEKLIHDNRYDFYIVMWYLIIIKGLVKNIDIDIATDLRLAWTTTFDRDIDYSNTMNKLINNKPILIGTIMHDQFSIPLAIKIMPLTVIENVNPFDIRYRVWREIYTIRMIIELYKNKDPCADYFLDYHLPFKMAYNVDANIFGNPNIIARYTISDQIIENQKNIDQIVNDSFISGTEVDKKLREYAQITHELSNAIIQSGNCIIAQSTSKIITKLYNYKNIESFNYVMYSCMYALIVIHCRFGIIHGDMHLGNVCYYQHITKKYLIYNDIHEYYQQQGGCVILDFSRSIINPYHVSAQQFTQSNLDVIAAEQSILIEQLYLRIYPNGELIDQIHIILHENFELGFKIMSLLDIIDIIIKLSQQNINQRIKYYTNQFLTCVEHIMKQCIQSRKCDDIDPLFTILNAQNHTTYPNVQKSKFNVLPFTIDEKLN